MCFSLSVQRCWPVSTNSVHPGSDEYTANPLLRLARQTKIGIHGPVGTSAGPLVAPSVFRAVWQDQPSSLPHVRLLLLCPCSLSGNPRLGQLRRLPKGMLLVHGASGLASRRLAPDECRRLCPEWPEVPAVSCQPPCWGLGHPQVFTATSRGLRFSPFPRQGLPVFI